MTAPFVFATKFNGFEATISPDYEFHLPYQSFANEFVNKRYPLSQADIFFENKCIEFFDVPPSFRPVRDKYYYGRRDIFYRKVRQTIKEKHLQLLYPNFED